MAETIQERLVDVLRSVFGDDELDVTDHTTAADVPEWDSLANINLLFALEEEFGVRFRDDEFSAMRNVGELRSFLERQPAR